MLKTHSFLKQVHMPAIMRILQKVSVYPNIKAMSTYLDVYHPHVIQHLSEDKASCLSSFWPPSVAVTLLIALKPVPVIQTLLMARNIFHAHSRYFGSPVAR